MSRIAKVKGTAKLDVAPLEGAEGVEDAEGVAGAEGAKVGGGEAGAVMFHLRYAPKRKLQGFANAMLLHPLHVPLFDWVGMYSSLEGLMPG